MTVEKTPANKPIRPEPIHSKDSTSHSLGVSLEVSTLVVQVVQVALSSEMVVISTLSSISVSFSLFLLTCMLFVM